MKNLTLLYISLSGNTKSFINRLEKLLSKDYNIKTIDIKDLIKEKNIKTLKDLCEIGDIGNVCGGCREDLDMVLEEVLNSNV